MRAWTFAGVLLGGLGVFACGSLADSGKTEPIAKVQGSLTGADVPAGAHVALVWRRGAASGYVVSHDAPLVNGHFAIDLAAPPADELFFAASGGSSGSADEPVSVGSGGAAPTGPNPNAPSPTPAPGAEVRPQTTVSGDVSSPMTAAIAGFVVYVDANGNGALDLTGDHAGSPDTIVGGNKELLLVYLRGGTTLAYEKLRDKAGQLPSRGYNLFWDEGRVLPLTAVELELRADARLPRAVCRSFSGPGSTEPGSPDVPPSAPPSSGNASSDPSGPSGGGTSSGSGGGSYPGYPAPGSPGLTCSPDGRSFSYNSCPPPPPPPPSGLCTDSVAVPTIGCAGYGTAIPSNAPVPPGWPCPVHGETDGGTAPPPPVPTDAGLPHD